jgi:hypothetical protein
MATRTIYGQVESNGDVLAGAGFQSSRVSTGVYTIDFTQDFTGAPAVNVTPIGYDNNVYNIRHVFIKEPSSGQCIVYLFNTSSPPVPSDSRFNFIAIGED